MRSKVIAKIERSVQVGIFENCTLSIRIYPDRTLVREPYIRWVGNTGGYAERNLRLEGEAHMALIRAADRATQDRVDPTDYVFDAYQEMAEVGMVQS
jgi:hypothetical protein